MATARITQLAAGVVVAAGLLAGCSSTSGSTPGALVHGSPLAAVPGADKATALAIVGQCLPVKASAAAQLQWATDIMNDALIHPNGSRQRLLSCAGIPGANQQAAQSALVGDIMHVRWDQAPSRVTFWGTTMPGWVMQWRSA
jgi:hypothetical protein